MHGCVCRGTHILGLTHHLSSSMARRMSLMIASGLEPEDWSGYIQIPHKGISGLHFSQKAHHHSTTHIMSLHAFCI